MKSHDKPSSEKYLSLSHLMPEDETTKDGAGIKIFSIPTAEVTTIVPQGPTERRVYEGIFTLLQGPPKTKDEIIGGLGLETDEEKEFAGQVFDALEMMTAITAATGLARSLKHTWQNTAPYAPKGYASPEEAEKDKAPRVVPKGSESFAFDVEPSVERETVRLFDPQAAIAFADLQAILVDSYRTSADKKRPTPSAGGIYPLDIHVISHDGRVEDSEGKLVFSPGIYQYDPNGLSLETRSQFDPDSGRMLAQHLTDDVDGADPALWITLSADMKAFEQKYGNASQVFFGTSVGSVMQRLIEAAEEKGYGTLPYFGIRHHYADEILGNEGDVTAVMAIGIGRRAPEDRSPEDLQKATLARQLERMNHGTTGIITGAGQVNFATGRYTGMPSGFVGAWVEYAENHGDKPSKEYSFGTDTTYEGAVLKATAEALERAASGNVRVDYPMAAATQLDASWIDPRVVTPFDATQLAISGTHKFTPDLPLNWTAGTRLKDGSKTYAPSELIYYPYFETETPVAYTTSSGVAAYFGEAEATKRAMLELIERDAIMRTWITQESPRRLPTDDTPESVAARLRDIAARGKQIDILDMTQENGVPVYMAAIRSDSFPHFYVGASAGFDPEAAMHKALDEAVVGFISRVASEESARKEYDEKRSRGEFDLDSHAMLYATDPDQVSKLEWLFAGDTSTMPAPDAIPSMDDLIERYNPAVFTLDNPAPGNELNVVRVIAEDLIPIQFGKTGVPYKHHTLPPGTTAPDEPHFFN